MKNAPCYGCERKQVGCHDVKTCEGWRDWINEQNRRRAEEEKQRCLKEVEYITKKRLKRKLKEL